MTTRTRREAIALAAAAAALPLAAAATRPGSLQAIARANGMRFGSAIAWCPRGADAAGIGNPAYTRVVEAECGLVVAENEMTWLTLRPAPGVFAFDPFDAILGLAALVAARPRGGDAVRAAR